MIGTRDPGYGTTARMISESALALLDTENPKGGLWSPGAALGEPLLKRLEEHAHMKFQRDE